MVEKKIEHIPHLGVAIPELGWLPAPRYSMRRARVLKLIGQGNGKLLDIGCGPGAMLVDFSNLGWQPEGLETSENSHEIGKEFHNKSDRKLYKTPQKNWGNRFDIITAFEVIEHIENDFDALGEWGQWLKDEGTIVISVPAHSFLWNRSDENVGHYRRYSKKQLMSLITAAGFSVEHVEYYGFPVATLIALMMYNPFTYFLKNVFSNKKAIEETNILNQTYKKRSEKSGSDREFLVKLWPFFKSWPYKICLAMACTAQTIPILQYFGNGLIIVARKK